MKSSQTQNKGLSPAALRAEIARLSLARKCELMTFLAEQVRSGKGGAEGVSIRKMIEVFLNYTEFERGRAKNTIESYGWDLGTFLQFCEKKGIESWGAVDIGLIQEFIADQSNSSFAATTINRRIACLKSCVRCAKLKGYLYDDRVLEVPRLKKPERLHSSYTANDVERLIEATKTTTSRYTNCQLGIRDRAIIEFLYSTGCRVQEVADIKLDDLNFEDSTAKITGKGNRQRVVCLTKSCASALQEYLKDCRPRLAKPVKPKPRERSAPPYGNYVFLSKAGCRLGEREFRRVIKKYGDKLGFLGLSPHDLRHAAAQGCFDRGMALEDVRFMLGHRNIATTQIYAQGSTRRLKEQHKRFHPRAQVIKKMFPV